MSDGVMVCPVCRVPCDPITGRCASCERTWTWVDSSEGRTLQSLRRRVRLTKRPEVGDNLNDVIKPV